jgi:hypothetical protein
MGSGAIGAVARIACSSPAAAASGAYAASPTPDGGYCEGGAQYCGGVYHRQLQEQYDQYNQLAQNIENQNLEYCGCHYATQLAIVREWQSPAFAAQMVLNYVATARYDASMLAHAEAVQAQSLANQQASGGGFWGFIKRHEVGIGVVLGVAALATGFGAIYLGAIAADAAIGAGAATAAATADATSDTAVTVLGATSTAAGGAAAYLDMPSCQHGNAEACFGAGAGMVGTLAGAAGIAVDTLIAHGVIEGTVALRTTMLAIGAGGWSIGAFGTAADIGAASQTGWAKDVP